MGDSGKAPPSTVLAPGFRFHPTDEELVWYYLRRKVTGKRFRLDVISEIDIYKVEPDDLPDFSKLKSKDREWYFFSALDRKYGNGMRTNRATEQGYWKTTGKDRPVHHDGRVVGMKKTLVYHVGRAPHGKRTDWVMHEYKLVDKRLEEAGSPIEGYVVCRIFRKSGSGPKNGEQYGAKFDEKEWEDNDDVNAVAGEVSYEDAYADDANADAFLEQNDLFQIPQVPHDGPLPDNFNSRGSQNCVEKCGDVAHTDQKPSVGDQECDRFLQVIDGQMGCDHIQASSSANVVKNEYIAPPRDKGSLTPQLLEDLFADVGSAPIDDGLYFDADISDPASFGSAWDVDFDDIAAYLNFDSSPEAIDATDLGVPANQNLDGTCWHMPPASELLPGSSNDSTGSSSNQVMDVPMDKPSKTASSMTTRWLENIPAHPALASEMPSKEMASRLTAAVQSSSPVRVTAGIIRIGDMHMPIGARGSELQWSFDKTGNVSVLLSFDVPQAASSAGLESFSGIHSSKFAAAVSRGWMYFMFFWVLALAMSLKIGTCIYAK